MGAVRIQRGSPKSLEATVRGSRQYEVEVDWKSGELSVYCSCPFFDTEGPCKHLWAALLAAEARGYLSDTDAIAALRGDELEDLTEDTGNDPDAGLLFPAPPGRRKPAAPLRPLWRAKIDHLLAAPNPTASSRNKWPEKRQMVYVLDLAASRTAGQLVLSLGSRDIKKDGSYKRPVGARVLRDEVPSMPLEDDREILSAMAGAGQYYSFSGFSTGYSWQIPASSVISYPLAETILPRMARTGRCFLSANGVFESLTPLEWDDRGSWRFGLELCATSAEKQQSKPGWLVRGVLRRGEETMEISTPALVTEGHVIAEGRIAPLVRDSGFPSLIHFRRNGNIQAPAEAGYELLAALLAVPGLPRPEVPESLRFEAVTPVPQPWLRIRLARNGDTTRATAQLFFDYEGRMVASIEKACGYFEADKRRFVERDSAFEKAAEEQLRQMGAKLRVPTYDDPESAWELPVSKVQQAARILLDAGWRLETDGKGLRRPGAFHLEVSSGVDWFELHGGVEYGESRARLPELLQALRRGDNFVRLEDGSYGMLPEDWLRRIGALAGMGTPQEGHIRFRRSQAGLLDALLVAQPEVRFDEQFARLRDEIHRFHGVEAVEQPAGFVGTLRDYQREGLGWMDFLRRFSFGGCLADDMGVGKTAQVLALLEGRRELRAAGEPLSPSLAVVPRSLVFNWKQEAARFTPQLRVLDYTGLNRNAATFSGYDLVVTTYGTLRREAARLREIEFDYVALDEAQAVKNANTESAKAVRLLRGAHRLALSGTPVENHLGELWSLFEFLNPGMLGAASAFQLTSGAGRTPDEETRRLLSHALRPFILRRTKEQVARELPAKTEQTVYCELEAKQRGLYNELRDHYRDALLRRIETEGLAKSKIMVLEALLRLRQAACHPGLIDEKRAGEPSAKLEALIEQLREVLDAGHKALVFSQFTSLLKILRDRLDQDGVSYEYLDGRTRDRQARVEHFQNSADCPLFLISLKAGGLGLNLTAAEYVFLLDPWWNPAVEAQAVDRAHRIGQTRPVFAYRLIARDTVEEKVVELQKTKRALADAIIGEDNALIRNLRREDLELLLS
jgi:hypothetical protein